MGDPDIMKDLCLDFLKDEYKRAENASFLPCVALNEQNIIKLAQKILVLPLEDKNILFGHYCFAFPKNSIAQIFKIQNVSGQLRYVQELLSFAMGLEEEEISQESMKKACNLALQNYIENEKFDVCSTPAYSARFRKKLRNIKAAQRTSDLIALVMKRVAVFLVVCSVGFSAILVVNVDAREKFFAWIIDTFPQFSIFSPNISDENLEPIKDLVDFSMGYIPDGFVLNHELKNLTMISYEYTSDQNRNISISITTDATNYLNTEKAIINKIRLKGEQAYIWETGETSYIVWQQDGFFFDIIGDCSMEEVQKIAESIIKN